MASAQSILFASTSGALIDLDLDLEVLRPFLDFHIRLLELEVAFSGLGGILSVAGNAVRFALHFCNHASSSSFKSPPETWPPLDDYAFYLAWAGSKPCAVLFEFLRGERPRKHPKIDSSTVRTPGAVVHDVGGTDENALEALKANLATMPCDIIFEICKYGTPEMLLSLARTCKALREFLMSKTSVTIWGSAREREVPPIPKPPAGYSEPSMAALIYDECCFKCGQYHGDHASWGIMRRICYGCRQNHLIYDRSYGRKDNRDFKNIALALVPRSDIDRGARPFCLPEDVDKVSALLSEYAQAIVMGKRGAQQALNKFLNERRKVPELSFNMEQDMIAWYQDHWDLIRRTRHHDIFKRLRREGFEFDELSTIEFQRIPCVMAHHLLSDEEWVRIRPELHSHLVGERRRRAQAQNAKNMKNGYNWLRRQKVRPLDWYWFPSPEQFIESCELEGMPNQIHVAVPELCVEDQVASIISNLRDWVATHVCRNKDGIPKLYEQRGWPIEKLGIVEGRAGLRSFVLDAARFINLNLGPLELATLVFQTRSGETLIGRDVCYTWKHPSIGVHFSEAGTASAKTVVELAKELQDTTAEKMDEKDHRFVCTNCRRAKRGPSREVKAHTWRTSVQHDVSAKHTRPRWRLLRQKEANAVKARESTLASSEYVHTAKWYCQHCCDKPASTLPGSATPTNIGDDARAGWTYDGVMQHVIDAHEIAQPAYWKDYVYFSSHERMPLRTPLELVDYEVAPGA
ncbi:uncharacterized protein STEHIDRAFT_171805 [Stereum hirsutum FP-91666 SS1]|uniref:uncharacterized protein n=1 Tax=Stereum hirsutum (strain FP-91666) TaxID=721885 RepID=UPI0004449B54|nr:uncharacterized protein STEHIDRAFT_171805 [Stereum hirsutum FP-91666 SS1]EIM81430.1 hypothetical protein STEHIDRAFT_171805 [Stereum hirsutum FP-91666 SS1]